MPSEPPGSSPRRTPLTRERVLAAAMGVADADGLASLTMRSLARAVGVQPMSLYHHVANKDEILDGLVDAVFAEIAAPTPGDEWRSAVRARTASARQVLRAHPWAIALMSSRRNPGPANLRHHDAVIGTLRLGGFSVAMAAHAFSVIDSYLYGFVLTEVTLPFDDADSAAEVAGEIYDAFPAGEYPWFAELASDHVLVPGYDHGNEFDYGLDLILDGLAKSLPE